MNRYRAAPRSLRQVFAVPLALFLVSLFGLIAALVGNGVWDAAGWIALSLPVVAIIRARRRS